MQCNRNFSQAGRHDARLHHGKHHQSRSSVQPQAPRRRPQQQHNKQAGYLASGTQAAAAALARVGVVVTEVSSSCQLAYVLHSRYGRAHGHGRQASLEEKLFLCVFSPLLITLLVEQSVVKHPNLRDPLHVEILQHLHLLPKDFSPPTGYDMPVASLSDASSTAAATPAPAAVPAAAVISAEEEEEDVLDEMSTKPCPPLATKVMVEVFCSEPCAAPASHAAPNAPADTTAAANATTSSNSVIRASANKASSFLLPQPALFHGCSTSEPDMAVLLCQGAAGSETAEDCCRMAGDDDTGSTSDPTTASTPGYNNTQVFDSKLPLLRKLLSFVRKQQDGQDLTSGRGLDTRQPPAAASAQPSASAVSKRARAAAPKAGAGGKAARFGKAFAAVCACGGNKALQQVL